MAYFGTAYSQLACHFQNHKMHSLPLSWQVFKHYYFLYSAKPNSALFTFQEIVDLCGKQPSTLLPCALLPRSCSAEEQQRAGEPWDEIIMLQLRPKPMPPPPLPTVMMTTTIKPMLGIYNVPAMCWKHLIDSGSKGINLLCWTMDIVHWAQSKLLYTSPTYDIPCSTSPGTPIN